MASISKFTYPKIVYVLTKKWKGGGGSMLVHFLLEWGGGCGGQGAAHPKYLDKQIKKEFAQLFKKHENPNRGKGSLLNCVYICDFDFQFY